MWTLREPELLKVNLEVTLWEPAPLSGLLGVEPLCGTFPKLFKLLGEDEKQNRVSIISIIFL